ncbi:uncharacterized protein K460DRAFT_366366 [Cucurbitaria berberidis CBS 394.84]|uniref:2EXR domain-containing protein n=1 Tax=Cucurbitaria berberidis CBS 394.84 TaxID=1168544 RepID=A0A9P4GH31_9PLEO|nr:uncharacterized protein K460DRAFT_366366 [Cucurbitaria berberidis CBS 394.84]KAF1845492.1 hypothetical protein K460DRAFT_366366 [Cucurbitaria berberidis CBS 394.84]
MTVEPREVEVRIVKPTPEDPQEARWSHPSQWSYISNSRFEEAMSKVSTSTRAGRKARRKARKEWKPYQPYVHMVSSTIPAALHTCREARNHGLYQQISSDVDDQHVMDRRYVWLNLDIDLINIGTSYLAYFIPIASSFKRLKFSRAITNEWWCEYEKDLLPRFINAEEIRVLCIDGFWNWGDEVYNFSWPCAYENLVFIDEETPVRYLEVGHPEVGHPEVGHPEVVHLEVGHLEMRRIYRRMWGRESDDEEAVD